MRKVPALHIINAVIDLFMRTSILNKDRPRVPILVYTPSEIRLELTEATPLMLSFLSAILQFASCLADVYELSFPKLSSLSYTFRERRISLLARER
jgi:hypothetical protein